MPEIQIECKSRRCDRVDLTTRVNTFLCQLDARNKLGSKALNVLRFLCQDSLWIFSPLSTHACYEYNIGGKMRCL